MALPADCAQKMRRVLAVIRANVRIRIGVKTGNVQFLKELSIVMNARIHAQKAY